jgi:tRNA A-37 threonylcarbamoyl transferase component Bud32
MGCNTSNTSRIINENNNILKQKSIDNNKNNNNNNIEIVNNNNNDKIKIENKIIDVDDKSKSLSKLIVIVNDENNIKPNNENLSNSTNNNNNISQTNNVNELKISTSIDDSNNSNHNNNNSNHNNNNNNNNNNNKEKNAVDDVPFSSPKNNKKLFKKISSHDLLQPNYQLLNKDNSASSSLVSHTSTEFGTSAGRGSTHIVKESETAVVTKDEDGRKMVNEYIMIEKLGSGSYGKVKLVVHRETGQKFAIKIIKKSLMKRKRIGQPNLYDNVLREMAIMKKLDHPNIVKLYELIDDPEVDKLFIVMEYVPGGAVMNGNILQTPISEEIVWKYARDIIVGLDYLHFQGIIHRDIKPENILRADGDVLKIADFGVAGIIDDVNKDEKMIQNTVGSPAFLAPEVCSGNAYYGKGIDVWAVGATLFNMVFGHPPFIGANLYVTYELIQTKELDFDNDSSGIKITPLFKDLLEKILMKDPVKRIKIQGILEHPWITKENNAAPLFSPDDSIHLIQVSEEEVNAATKQRVIFIYTNIFLYIN